MKGLFLPEITTEMFKDGWLESIEALIGEGEIYDIDYSEPCEDAISRREVIEEINTFWLAEEQSEAVLIDMIEALPSVNPVKTGHWIEDENEMEVRCSECAEENDKCSKYCPNCGAKMVEPQESEG